MANETTRREGQQNKEFIYGGFKRAPIAMFLTLMALAIIGLFGWVVVLSNKISSNAEQQVKDAREDKKEAVDQIIKILRPDLQEIKDNVQQARDNTDTVKNNAIIKNKRK